MPNYVTRHTVLNGEHLDTVLRSVLQFQGRQAAAATALADSSTGTAGTMTKVATTATNVAASGLSLADKATTEAALGTVRTALATLFAKANAAATAVGLGLATVTYSGGGTSGGNTLGAVTKTVTGAATGAQATEFNAVVSSLNSAFYILTSLVNRLAVATGETELDASALTGMVHTSTVAAIGTGTGTAASPGVTKVAADAVLVAFANNAATIAAAINDVIDGAGVPDSVAV